MGRPRSLRPRVAFTFLGAGALISALFATATDAPAAAGWAQQWLDVTEPWEMWWLLLGLLAQVTFFSRWIIQWVASEVRRESVIPVLFLCRPKIWKLPRKIFVNTSWLVLLTDLTSH